MATDTTLGRDVAIKVLPETFDRDPERTQRFDREVTAGISQPSAYRSDLRCRARRRRPGPSVLELTGIESLLATKTTA